MNNKDKPKPKKLETNVPLVHPKNDKLETMVGATCFVILFLVFITLVLVELYNQLSSWAE